MAEGAYNKTLGKLRLLALYAVVAALLWLSRPRPIDLAVGGLFLILGEWVRLWAAGHLVKTDELDCQDDPETFADARTVFPNKASDPPYDGVDSDCNCSNDFDVEEGSAAYLPDGSIGTPSRCTSAWFQSYDHGKTWSAPRQLHVGTGTATRSLYKKGDLVVTSRGVVVLVFCGGPGGRGQVIYSRDSGKTWIKPARDRGFKFDELAYYPNACVLEDDSIFVVGDHQGFKNKFGPFGAEVTAVRFRVKSPKEGEGIELLPIGDDSSKN